MLATLVLLSVLIAVVTVVIGDSTARAFSLVGALSIVRFRTVVEDTRDTAFVIFAVVEGMAVAGDHLATALAGFVIIAVAAAVVRPKPEAVQAAATGWNLRVRVGLSGNPEARLRLHPHLGTVVGKLDPGGRTMPRVVELPETMALDGPRA